MNQKQLFNLKQLIRDAKAGDGGLTIEEIDDLQRAVQSELYVQRIKDFKQAIDKALPHDLPNATYEQQAIYDEKMQQFYDTDWFIQFGEHKVTISNEATVYNYIVEMLQELIENCL